jgi:arylsulfatase A-like enzyme
MKHNKTSRTTVAFVAVLALRELGIEKNTVIFFAGDNGYSQWGYFGRAAHEDDPVFKNKGPWPKGKFTCTHEGGMRVPFFAYWPGTITPGASDHVCALYDFAATAADLASVEAPATDGISLLPTLLGKPDQQRDHAYLYWENGSRSPHAQSARRGPWWASRDNPAEPVQLFRIDRDLACERDVAGDHPEVVEQFRATFHEAHAPSEWYVNPGEGKDRVAAKRQRAQADNGMQVPVGPNTRSSPW